MGTIDSEAISELTRAMQSLLPVFDGDTPQAALHVIPTQLTSTGIGGFVGFDRTRVEETFGRRIEATVSVSATASSRESLSDMISEISAAFLCAGRQKVMGIEILRLKVSDQANASPSVVENEAGFTQLLSYSILCEYLKTQGPSTPGGIIDTIPVELDLNETSETPKIIYSAAFVDMGLNETGETSKTIYSAAFNERYKDKFEIIDDPLAKTDGPSDWRFNSGAFKIEQLSRIRGGRQSPDYVNKAGTYLVLQDRLCRLKRASYMVKATLRSASAGGIGVVFNFRDEDNLCFFLMDSKQGYRVLAKKSSGVFAHLSAPAVDKESGFPIDEDLEIKVLVTGSRAAVYLNRELVLQGQDAEMSSLGRIGLMSRDNDTASFYQLGVMQL